MGKGSRRRDLNPWPTVYEVAVPVYTLQHRRAWRLSSPDAASCFLSPDAPVCTLLLVKMLVSTPAGNPGALAMQNGLGEQVRERQRKAWQHV